MTRTPSPALDPCALSIAELAAGYRSGKFSAVDVVARMLDRIKALNPRLNAYVTVLEEPALAAAHTVDLQLAAGIDLGPLHGVPMAVKDVIRVAGARTSAASRVLQNAPLDEEDAPVVRSLRSAGAIIVGKTNLDEFGVATVDSDSPFARVENPRKLGRQTGGSSSGSAAAVAAGLAAAALGTDAGGSVRHPASVCGLVGLKPTYGLVPMRGVIASSASMDNVGVLARSVADVAAVLRAVVQTDAGNMHSGCATLDPMAALGQPIRGLRVGFPTNPECQFGVPDVRSLNERAHATLRELSVTPVAVTIPSLAQTNDLADTILGVDHYAFHENAIRTGRPFGAHFARRAAVWRAFTAQDYADAQATRSVIRRAWDDLFQHVDIIVLPANGAGAPRHGEEMILVDGVEEPIMRVNSRFNRVSNLTGCPALTLPIGQTSDGLPVGIQLVGPLRHDAHVLSVAHALEGALGYLSRTWGVEPNNG